MRNSGNSSNDIRSNAQWGSGSRGDSRRNMLWGSGGGKRGNALWGRRRSSPTVLTAIAACTLLLPLAAGAKDGSPGNHGQTFVTPGLLDKAAQNPGQKLHVIVQSSSGASDATDKIVGLGSGVRKRLDVIGAVAIDITAGKLATLAKQPGLTITPDSLRPPQRHGLVRSDVAVRVRSREALGTATSPAPQAPTIAIVDSGIEANRADFGNGSRVVGNVTLTGLDREHSRRRPWSRHLRRRDCGGLGRSLCRRGSERGNPLDRRDGRHRHGSHERRHRRVRLTSLPTRASTTSGSRTSRSTRRRSTTSTTIHSTLRSRSSGSTGSSSSRPRGTTAARLGRAASCTRPATTPSS